MKILDLSEAEIKVAIREYVDKRKNSYKIEWAWGLMECYVNDNIRINSLITRWPDEKGDLEQ